jgi:signal transduction histidine kinase
METEIQANPPDNNQRVLVLARIGRDGQLLSSTLHRGGFLCHLVNTADELLHEFQRGAATAVVTEESLNGSSANWVQRLQMQPAWSDFPLILLTGTNPMEGVSPVRMAALRQLGNVTLLERPVPSESLLSAVQAALRARARQYEIRDYMRRQADSQEALRRTEKLAVAGRLAASIAHEINNPLAAITNLLYLVNTSKTIEDARKYGLMAQDEVRRVSEIANQTLRFYRSPNAPESVNASQLVDSALALFKAKLRNNNIQVKREYAEDCMFVCSVGEIRQVLVNLIANAIDAMPEGGALYLRTAAAPHPLTSVPGIRITIADHGEGVAEAARKKLFEPFFTTKGSIGTGLGLWLTRDIIERGEGYIRFRNHRSPHGAIFSVWLPLEPACGPTGQGKKAPAD